MKRTFTLPALLILMVVLVYGCGSKVDFTIDEQFPMARAHVVATAPVVWEAGRTNDAEELGLLFRTMSAERLRYLNYDAIPLDEVNSRVRKIGTDRFAKTPAPEAASLLGTEAVLIIRVTEWDVDRLPGYASLKLSAVFELYSARGTLLWQAEYTTKESDMKLDTDPLELAIVKAYEPRVQRFVDTVMNTLPRSNPRVTRKTYFDWLP